MTLHWRARLDQQLGNFAVELAVSQDTFLAWTIARLSTSGVPTILLRTLGAPSVHAGDLVKLHHRNGRLTLWHGQRRVMSVVDPSPPLTGTKIGFYGESGAQIGQLRGGPGDSTGPWEGGLLEAPAITRATQDLYFGVLEPDDASLKLAPGTMTRDEVLALRTH